MQFDIDLKSVYKNLFLDVRRLLLSNPEIIETKKKRITTYSNKKGGICHLRTMDHGIDLGFLKGVQLEDKLSLLHGNGKTVRVISLKGYHEIVINYYIDQALEMNNKKKLIQQF